MARTGEDVTNRDRRHGRSERIRWPWVLIGAGGAVLAVFGDWWGASLVLLVTSLAYAARLLEDFAAERDDLEHAAACVEVGAAMDRVDAGTAGLETTLGGRTLADALEAYARRLDADGVRIRVHGAAPDVGPRVATQAYCVGVEAMTSAVRHAHADVIDVAVDADEERLRLLVTDNGTRPSNAAQEAAHAIGAMRARARALGGRLLLACGPSGHGASVLLDVPRIPEPPAG
jgi:hypothetical protein